jgi:uncharacterized protein (DUF58 family)
MLRSPAEPTVDGPPPIADPRRWSWRASVLSLALLAALGAIFGLPVYRSLTAPQVGDRHEVTYEAEDRCGSLVVRTAGIEVRGNAIESGFDEPVPAGQGTLVLTSVTANDRGGYEVDGVLELAGGSTVPMHGWSGDGDRFWPLGCAIRTS